MSRILSSSLLLAAALVVAGCGGSSSNSSNDTSLLKGQFAFEEQVYTAYATSDAKPAATSGRFAGHKLQRVPTFVHRERALATLQAQARTRSARSEKSSSAVPEQGDGMDSNIAWGAEVGSLTFDGNGNVTAGELDFNEPTAGVEGNVPVTGSYSVGSDQVGTIQLQDNQGGSYTYQITLQGSGVSTGSAATGAQLLEGVADDLGDAEIGTGHLVQQTSSPTQGSLKGNYVFGVQGQTCYGTACPNGPQGDLFAAGLLAADGAGNFGSSGQADIATGFNTDNQVGVTGTYGTPDANGRMTATLATTNYTNGALPAGYAIYVANSNTAFIVSTDPSPSDSLIAPFIFGELDLQSGTFSSSTLSGNYVVAETTEDLQNETVSPDTFSDTFLALLTSSGGTVNGTGDLNLAGNISSGVGFTYGTATVAANGRVTLSGTTPSGAPAPVFWLQSASVGYGVDQLRGSTLQEPGLLYLYQQAGSGFSNSSLSGTFALGTLPAATSNVGQDSTGENLVGPGIVNGSITADGNGNVTGDGTSAYISGSGASGSFSGTYTVGSNGRGVITGSSSSLLGNEIFYLATPGVAVASDFSAGDSSPSLQIIHQ